MPVTAKLSLLFYEKLGEQVATELVDWFNSVDATYRSDLRELNELNFARFDAKLEQRVATLDAKMEQRFAELRSDFEQRMAELGAGLRIEMESRFALVDARFETLEAKLLARLDTRIEATRTALLRWMFAGWSSLMLAMLGTLFAVLLAR